MSLKRIGSIKYTTTLRVLPAQDGKPRLEVTGFGGSGDLNGNKVIDSSSTYNAWLRSDGNWQGECPNSGIIFVEDGMVTFSATGIGSPPEDGGNSWKGVTYFETSAPSLAQLNGKCIVYNWDVDAQGVAVWELFEYS